LVRAKRAVSYPSAFMLVAAMNPCLCGHHGDPYRVCTCSSERVLRYRGRISGPLLDRFDMHLWIGTTPYRELQSAPEGESSASIRYRVDAARRRQRHRFADRPCLHTNSQMPPTLLRHAVALDRPMHDVLAAYSARTAVSMRGIERILRVARTIADLREGDAVTDDDVVRATAFRYLDQEPTPDMGAAGPLPEVEGNHGGLAPARDCARR
jgi:magnesium chelatase family protein